MSVIVLCPACGTATPFHRPPVASCPHCQAALPATVRAPAERALAVEQAPKPFLLQVGMIGSALCGAIFVAVLVLAPFNLGTYTINGAPATGPEFLRAAGVPFGLLGTLLLAIGFGLWFERAWTRLLMIGFWGVMLALGAAQMMDGSLTVSAGLGGIVEMLIALALAGWYLYQKPNVVAYYERLEHTTTATPPGREGES